MFPATIDRKSIPHKPGVYVYKDINGSILYVGKAIDLYHRVASYFRGVPSDLKTAALVERIVTLETIIVESELEALILEANLIKKYLPHYNIRLTDDRDYLYIKITKELFPRIITARKKELADAKDFFGPFPSSRTVRETLKKLRRIFPWCSKPYGERPCFYYHLGQCPGPCAGQVDQKEYGKIINLFSKFMEGKKMELLENLKDEMEGYAKNQQFEQAEATKKILVGLNYLTQPNRAHVYLENPNFVEDQNNLAIVQLKEDLKLKNLPDRIECFDISHISGKQAVGSLVVLTGGDIDKKWYRRFKIHITGTPNDVGMMREMVRRRLKHDEWPKPDLILVDGGKGQVNMAAEELIKRGWNIPVFGLAKRMEWLYLPDGMIIKLPRASLSLRLLQKIRDEAHRFAVTYHRKLRNSDLGFLVYNKDT